MLSELAQTWSDPAARHAVMVHGVVVLPWIALAAGVAMLALRLKHAAPAAVAAALLLAAMGAAGLAAGAGEASLERIRQGTDPALTADEQAALHRHEELGEGAWKWPLAAALPWTVAVFTAKRARLTASAAGLAATIGVCGWAVLAGHSGGRIVYTHGLGVPARQPAAEAPQR